MQTGPVALETTPIDPFRPAPPPRARTIRRWIVRALVVYLLYASFCVVVESAARAHFRIPSKAGIAFATDRVARIRLEAARMRAQAELDECIPYTVYGIVVATITICGTVITTGFVARSLWRRLRGSFYFPVKLYVGALAATRVASLLLLMGPPLAAKAWLDATRSPYGVAPALPGKPGPAAAKAK
jgi:hypothetical protein